MNLGPDQIHAIVRQRAAWALIDRVTRVEPGVAIAGYKSVSANEPLLGGDAAGRAALPNVVLVEALSQLASVLAYVSAPFETEQKAPYCVGVERAKFLRSARPGERVDLSATVVRHRTNIWKLHGEASIDGQLALELDLHLSVIDRESAP